MTPDELRLLVIEATGGAAWAIYEEEHHEPEDDPKWTERYVTEDGVLLNYEPGDLPLSKARLIALAPDLARLCAELGEALFQEADCRYDLQFGPCTKRQIKNGEACPTCSALARLSQLKPST